MEVQTESELKTKRKVFFSLVFGQNTGFVCIAYLDTKRKFREEFFNYPNDLEKMLTSIEENVRAHNVYFCPHLFSDRKRVKENVTKTPNAWSDLDTCDPNLLLVKPTVVLESSPGRYQALWAFDKTVDPDDAENLSKRIAYTHREQGADVSGWDLTQLLRVPYTYNYKYDKTGNVPTVKIIEVNRNLYRLTDFKMYPEVEGYVETDIPLPEGTELEDADDLLQSKRLEINPLIWRYYSEEPIGDWSKVLWNLEMLLFEAGFTREQVYSIAQSAKCNKYVRDGKPNIMLWKEVCRAELRAEMHEELEQTKPAVDTQLLTDEERERLEGAEPTFIERYIEWASSLGDAAPQYHQAGAFVILSSLLAGSIRLPTSYGTIIPNLWFMILADTTLTRKTTAMDIAMDLVMEIDDDVVMATDGSLEGLLSALGSRPGRPSVFLRDEFSGLLEAMTKKDYMAGMPELLTKLYDGKFQKRILRKEVVEVRDPRLVFFAGGIKNKITGLLNFEHVSSGFMPRFIFITAESDITRLRPIGPPTARTTGNKNAIMAEMEEIYKFYNQTQELEIKKLKATIPQKVVYEAEMTPEAWIRYNLLETDLLQKGLDSDKPEILTPVGDRLSKSILKAALLLSAARQREFVITITEEDILRAIRYGEQWYRYSLDVMDNVGKGSMERLIDNILGSVRRNHGGMTRSKLMQNYHLTARDAEHIFSTLEQRGLVTRAKAGRGELIIARGTK